MSQPNLLLELNLQTLVGKTTDQIKDFFLDQDIQYYFQSLASNDIYAFETIDEMIPWASFRNNLISKLQIVVNELSELVNDYNSQNYITGYNDVSIDDYSTKLEPEYTDEYYRINDAIELICKHFEI